MDIVKSLLPHICVIAIILFSIIACVSIINLEVKTYKEDERCFKVHIYECEYCHGRNQTYSLCSGFCSVPRDVDFEMACAVHPQEACTENVPMRCIV